MNVLSSLFSKHKNRARHKRYIKRRTNFTELPADVFSIILGELVDEHKCFKPPRALCHRMKDLLELRTVCSRNSTNLDVD